VTPAGRRAAVRSLQTTFRVSERRACAVVGVGRSTVRVRPQPRGDGELRVRLQELAGQRRRFGYRRLHALLRQEGYRVNHKRVARLYREEGLAVRPCAVARASAVPRLPASLRWCPPGRTCNGVWTS
jgi:putative transposase